MSTTDKYKSCLIISFAILVILIMADLMSGRVFINPLDIISSIFGNSELELNDVIIRGIRLPRIITAILAGSAMSLAGMQMQAIFRNPLADPHIMGVSSGASLGAAIATILLGSFTFSTIASFLSGFGIILAAFIGAGLASLIIIWAASKFKSMYSLLVFGVVLGFSFSAITSIIAYSANADSLKIYYTWSSGSLINCQGIQLVLLGISVLIGLLLAFYNHRGMDIILFGDDFSLFAGASVKRIRLISMISTCILTSTVTAFCGPLGFVGIAAPHIARKIFNTSIHRRIIIPTIIIGANLTLIADILSQLGPIPLPIGSTLALVGIPIIILIMLRRNVDS